LQATEFRTAELAGGRRAAASAPIAIVARSDITDLVTDSDITGTEIVIAIVVLVISAFAARMARRAVLDILGKLSGVSEDLRQLAGRFTKYFVLLIGVGVALTFLGASVQPFITAAIIVAVVAALALRGVAENFAAGVVIQTRRPIQLGDDIRAIGHGGVVRELNGRSVVIETDDGQTVHLPNGKVLDNPIINNSTTAAHRTDVEVCSAGSDDVDATMEAILAATTAVAGVLADPAPVVLVRAIAPEEVTTVVRFWHHPSSGALVTSAVVRGIATAERSRGILATVVTTPAAPPPPPPPSPTPGAGR
jgi:small-conductance mechanosensitive channel